ncbi:MAG: nucleotide sugar dehydrogenase, partial [Chloroflexi bacterium]
MGCRTSLCGRLAAPPRLSPTLAVGGGRSTPHALSSRRQIDPRARLPPRPTARRGRTTDYGGSVNEDRRVAVIGLGYVGLPLAIAFTEAGLEVEGIDALPSRVAELCAGTSPIDDVSDERLRAALNAGLRITGPETAGLRDDDAVFVCVPTPITSTKDPDLGPLLSAAATIRERLRAGQLVILQSTTFPGTTNGPFRAALEEGGLKAGADFDLAFAPERVNPGDPA